jgi:hypothetical protein
MEGLVSDIPAGDGKTVNLFYSVMISYTTVHIYEYIKKQLRTRCYHVLITYKFAFFTFTCNINMCVN